jgi:exodeoxyribonuclease VII large subunit
VFGMNKELLLPLVPQRIAEISAPNAAGYGDFLQHLSENPYQYNVHTTLFDSMMQGTDAPASIINALIRINESNIYDLVVLIRGGGSQLDLECFNDYNLNSHLAQFPLPIITGIGHERDDTIADMVAHTKLKTPTAVAEFIIQGIASYEGEINDRAAAIGKMASYLIQNSLLKLQGLENKVKMDSKAVLLNEGHTLSTMASQIKHYAHDQLTKHQLKLEKIEVKHELLNPENSLKRGFSYSMVDGKPLFISKALKGQNLTTYSLDQKIESTIISTKKYGKS